MAANTAFAGLPLLLALMAKDGFVPRQFTKRGKRLGFSNGIIVLSFLACILVILFKGDTHLLIAFICCWCIYIIYTITNRNVY